MPEPAAPLDPSKESGEYMAMKADWTMISDIMAGAAAIRAKTTVYLPKYEGEDQDEYKRRVQTSPWRPEFSDAVRSLASKPFDKEIRVNNPPDAIKPLTEDIDGRGNNLTAFSRELFRKGIAKGLHAILVDYPTMEPGQTRAAEIAAGARPYWVQIEADNIIALYTRVEEGREIVAHVRIREKVIVQDGFSEKTVDRIRVMEPGKWELWEKPSQQLAWAIVEKGEIARGTGKKTSIPLVLFFTGERIGELQVKPPLADLAQMQIELYQALSRLDEILTFASSPMLVAQGMNAPGPGVAAIQTGPKRVLFAPPGGDGVQTGWSYIQPASSNISEIRQHIQSVTDDIRRLAMQPLTARTGRVTATAAAIEAAKAHSSVQSWALGMKDALEQAFVFTDEWMDINDPVEVEVSTDFGVEPYADAPLAALDNARARKDISQETFWKGLQRFGVLPPDFDPEEEQQELGEELQGLEPEAPIDPVTGQPIPPQQIGGKKPGVPIKQAPDNYPDSGDVNLNN